MAEKILIIEDTERLCRDFEKILEMNYICQVACAADCLLGFEKLRKQKFDLLLADVDTIQKSGLSNYEFIVKAKENSALEKIKIVFMASAENHAENHALKHLLEMFRRDYIIQGFFFRPISDRRLVSIVGKVLAGKNVFSYYLEKPFS